MYYRYQLNAYINNIGTNSNLKKHNFECRLNACY